MACGPDTEKCPAMGDCCRAHVAEMQGFLAELLKRNHVEFVVKPGPVFLADGRDHTKLAWLAERVNRKGRYWMHVGKTDRKPAILFYSRANHVQVRLYFGLNLGEYVGSDHEITNHRVVSWAYDSLLRAVDSFEALASRDGPRDRDVYGDIPYNVNWFCHHLQTAHDLLRYAVSPEQESLSFLDVGCGVGTKVKVASGIFDAYGVELHPPYARVAQALMQNTATLNYGGVVRDETERIFIADALEFDYSRFDVIYFFNPIKDYGLERRLERKIWRTAKEGAVVIPIWGQSKPPEFMRPVGEVLLKMTDDLEWRGLQPAIERHVTGPG